MMSDEEREFQRAVTEGLVPRLKDSSVCVAVCPDEDGLDAKFCVELGAMILLDKPIIIFSAPGRPISEKLRLVADEVVEADLTTDEGQEALRALLERLGAT